MKLITIDEARRLGYTIDTTVYPHFAYKGPRFAPTQRAYCLTEREAKLVEALRDIKADADYLDECYTVSPELIEAIPNLFTDLEIEA